MSDVRPYLWLIPALPLAASALTGLLGPRLLRRQSHWPCVIAAAISFILSVMVFMAIRGGVAAEDHGGVQTIAPYYSWIQVGVPGSEHAVDVGLTLRADPLTAMMLVMITFISTLIAIYSIGYMDGDPGYARFFAAVSLFIFSMTLLVLADNFLVLYAGWEGVGLCSYLLIGFWFTKPSAADAARKAFLVTRIGDVGLLLGILLLWVSFGYHLDFTSVFDVVQKQATMGTLNQGVIVGVCLLLFCGAAGKSAQFPLHVWLPDAMEGPTPVSALIHAATMVTAGVYLVARCTPLFSVTPEAQLIVATIGGITAILAAFIALTQNDLKRVMAYSTLSQLGYMFLALGSGIGSLASFAAIAAMLHLFTHAFFKALLFLGSGSVMHAMGGVIDMRRFSGLRKVMPTTHWTFLCGALALAGFPMLSGFWSKDEVMAVVWEAFHANTASSSVYLTLFVVGMITAFLTPFYTFRAYFMTFWGELRVPPEAGSHGHGDHDEGHHGHDAPGVPAEGGHGEPQGVAHESPAVMTIPLMILAFFAIGAGLALGPTHLFGHFVERTPGFPHLEIKGMHWEVLALSSVLGLGGIGLAWLLYVRKPELPGKIARAVPSVYQLSLNKLHIDELYVAFLVTPIRWLTGLLRALDYHLVDGLVDLIGQIPRLVGMLFRPIQNGLVQFYALAMVLALSVFLVALIRAL